MAASSKPNPLLWRPLQIGDTVDIVAPGFGISIENLAAARKFAEDLGLKVRIPSDIFGADVISAQTDEIRARHLTAALGASDSRAVWCLRGGYGAIRIIDSLRKMKTPKLAKIFIGYSDATTIHNFLNQFWNWPTLHGPLLDRLGQHTLPVEQVNECLDVIFGRSGQVFHSGLEPLNAEARKNRTLSGRVFGGNLTVTQSHLGTAFQKAPKDAILIFEDIGERGYRVDRILFQLEQAAYFKSTKAIIFGDFVGGEEKNGEDRVGQVIERFAKEIGLPVFRGLPVGHGGRQRTVPLNTSAELRCGSEGTLTVDSGADLKSSSKAKAPRAKK